MFDAQTQDVWISISQRSIKCATKTQGLTVLAYQWGYTGLGNPFATTVNNPYPLLVGASSGFDTVFPDSTSPGGIRGPIEAYQITGTQPPWHYRRQEDGSTGTTRNADPFGTVQTLGGGVYPCKENRNLDTPGDASTITADGRRQWFDIVRPDGGVATVAVLPTPDTGGDLFLPVPAVILETNSSSEPVSAADKLRAEIENIFWISAVDSAGATINAEDTITDQNGVRYRIIRSGSRTELYSLWAMQEN